LKLYLAQLHKELVLAMRNLMQYLHGLKKKALNIAVTQCIKIKVKSTIGRGGVVSIFMTPMGIT
jgi:hypothetical protein